MGNTLKAASATANITPPLGTEIPGGFRPRYAENVDDELFAKALVIDNGETRIAIVTCDLIAIPEKIANIAKARIAERCGIPPAYVMVNATHTHTAVAVANLLGVGEDTGYTDWVPLKIADAVALAVWRLQPARVGFASVNEERITFNRRWHMKDGTVRFNPGVENPDLVEPTGTIDPELAMMFVEAADGTPISAVANFSLHYIGTDNGSALSADYFGHFDRLMRRYLGDTCVSLLWNAASGQINNTDFSGRVKWTASGHRQAVKMANVLAGHFITEMQFMEMHDRLDLYGELATLTFQRKQITAEDLKVAEQILSVPQGTYDAYETGPFSWVVGQPIPTALVDVYALECQRLAKLPDRDDGTRSSDPFGGSGDCRVARRGICGNRYEHQGELRCESVISREFSEWVYRLYLHGHGVDAGGRLRDMGGDVVSTGCWDGSKDGSTRGFTFRFALKNREVGTYTHLRGKIE